MQRRDIQQPKTFPADKSKLVAVPNQQIKPGVVPAKCIALIKAAVDGNLEQVVQLATDPEVDINFMASCKGNLWQEYYTALSAAVMNDHVDAMKFLLQQGASAELSTGHYGSETHVSVLCLTFVAGSLRRETAGSEEQSDLALFKPLLRATHQLNHEFIWSGRNSLVQHLIKITKFKDKRLRISLFFHEAVLKGQTKMLDEMLSLAENIEFTPASLKDYLVDVSLTAQEALVFKRALDHLVNKKIITQQTCQQMVDMLDKSIMLALKVESFPLALHEVLANPSKRKLSELFAELQQWLLPDEGLPSLPVDNSFFHEDDYAKTKDEIRSLQDPKRLRQYLTIDPSEFLTLLYAAGSPQGKNAAAELLAQLLLFYKDELLDDKNPLFNEDQQKICLSILNRLYNLSDSEKLTVVAYRKQSEDMRMLRYENAQWQEKVEALEEKVRKVEASEDRIKVLEDQVQRLLRQFESVQTRPQTQRDEPYPSSTPSLFTPRGAK